MEIYAAAKKKKDGLCILIQKALQNILLKEKYTAQNVYCIYLLHKKRGKIRTFICICLYMSKETQEGWY